MIRFRWYNIARTEPRAIYLGVTLDGQKFNGFYGPRTWTLDIYLGKRLLVVLFGRRHQ